MQFKMTPGTFGIYTLLLAIICIIIPTEVIAHGRLRAPPSRSTMWRYGFPGRPNYNDHELNCGGFSTHWGRNRGRCGVCGDNYADQQPRANEGGGKYGRGVIVREFSQGEIIAAVVEVTANHKGFFEFSLCPHNRPLTPTPEDCFQVLELADGSGTRWQLHDDSTPKSYTIPVRLPPDVTCSQCVFRWYWKSGNSWGSENGQSGLGYGPQETFMACSDIAIREGENKVSATPRGGGGIRPGRRPLIGRPRPITTTTTTTTIRPTTTTPYRREINRDDDRSVFADGEDSWESDSASDFDRTETEVRPSCRATWFWRKVGGMNEWCVTSCAAGFCPISHCCCGC